MPEAYASFPGLQIRSADMVFSTGVTPSICHVVAIPDAVTSPLGTLTLSDGYHTVSFTDCLVDDIYEAKTRIRKGTRTHLMIRDRRWRWRGKSVSGQYNVPRIDSGYDQRTIKTYTELFGVLFDALGETNYTIVPDLGFDAPPVTWVAADAALELAALAESVGCYIALGLDSRVSVISKSTGPLLPPNGQERIAHYDHQIGAYPSKIKIQFGPTVFQSFLGLRSMAVHDDYDTYTDDPDYSLGAWDIPGIWMETAAKDQPHAVFAGKLFWVQGIGLGAGPTAKTLPGGTRVSSIDCIFPLRPHISKYSVEFQSIIMADPFVVGNNYNGSLLPTLPTSLKGPIRCPIPNSIDLSNGLVQFTNDVFGISVDGAQAPAWASMSLLAAYNARESMDEAPIAYSKKVDTGLGGIDSGTLTVVSDRYRIIADSYTRAGDVYIESGEPGDNKDYLDSLAESMVAEYVNQFKTTPQASMEWEGIVAYSPSGNLPQMRWYVGDVVRTYGYKNTEGPDAPTHRQRRFQEEAYRKQ